ncbi:MAG: DUF1376 domain-containing protein [Candidatus Methylopumilus sp.]|jgi:uncharacterized protein YdaU (DUF1376 family)
MAAPSKTDVWMPLYIADYLADTSRLTTLQHGAYMLLIMDYWRNGSLPDDDAILAQITRMQPDAWSIARASISRFFSIENGQWLHGRIESEIEKAGVNSQKAHDRAVKAAAARWDKENATSNATSIPTGTAQEVLDSCPSPSPSPSPTESTTTTADKSKDLSQPTATTKTKNGTRLPEDWVLPKAWGEFALAEKPQWSADDVRRVAADFKDHWLANANRPTSKKADWLAAWRIWVRKEFSGKSSGFKTTAEKRTDNTNRAVAEFLGEAKTIEGEVVDA